MTIQTESSLAFVYTPRYGLKYVPQSPQIDDVSTELEVRAADRFEKLKTRYMELVGLTEDDIVHSDNNGYPVDMEDWTENVILLISAVETNHPVYLGYITVAETERYKVRQGLSAKNILNNIPNEKDIVGIMRFNNAPQTWPAEKAVICIGEYAMHQSWPAEGSFPKSPSENTELIFHRNKGRLDPLYNTEFFKRNAQREYIICVNHHQEDTRKPALPDLFDVATDMANRHRKILIKNITDHKECPTIVLKNNGTPWTHESMRQELYKRLQYTLERTCTYAVQEFADMQFESRTLCVDGKLVAMAGCVESYTPLWNEAVIDCKLEPHRNRSEAENYPEISRKMADYVREVLPEITSLVHTGQRVISIDVAMINGKPGIIEMNDAEHLGLYAMNMPAYFKALTTLPS